MNCPKHYMLITPNTPPLQKGKNIAPASIIHFWFMLKGPEEILPVPGAKVTGATKYAYVVADLVTSPVAEHVYQHSILITSTTLSDEGKKQTAEIIFTNGSKIILNEYTPAQLPEPLKLGGHLWNYHVDGDELSPAAGTPHNINKTRVMLLGLVPGPPGTTQVTIHAEPGTHFADYYGTNDVVSSQATFFRPNNIVNNSSRGELLWTTNPPYPVPAPPSLP